MTNRRLDDRYELRECVGSGGMAEVWEGFDHNLSRRIAIKMLHTHWAADTTILARFRSEAKAAARLTHPAIVAIYDTVGAEDTDAIIMEFVEGRDLRTILNERPTLAAVDAVEVGLQLAGALGHAHHNGIIHRDVKPANILVRPDRRVKLSDFGIAKALDQAGHTETGSLVGTVKYLAPEQIEGHPVDGRTDLYALSTVLYEMLCGEVPFKATDLAGAMARLRKDAPSARKLRPDLPLALDTFLQRGLSRDPNDRYPDAVQWAAGLNESMLGSRIERGDPTIIDPRPAAPASIPVRQSGKTLPRSQPTAAHPSTTHPAGNAIPQTDPKNDPVWSKEVPPARPSAKQRAKANPETAKHLKTGKSKIRWLGPLVALLLMLAAIGTVWFLLSQAGERFIERFDGDDNTVAQTQDTDDDAVASPDQAADDNAVAGDDGAAEDTTSAISTDFDVAGLRATSFDPQGDGTEHEEAVSRPFDGDPSTFWLTQSYRNRSFGELKEGVGLIVEFSEPRPMQDIEIEANRVGWSFDLYAADVAQSSLPGWGDPIASFSDLGESEVVDVPDRDVTALLFWITDLGLSPDETQEQYEAVLESGVIAQGLQISELVLVG